MSTDKLLFFPLAVTFFHFLEIFNHFPCSSGSHIVSPTSALRGVKMEVWVLMGIRRPAPLWDVQRVRGEEPVSLVREASLEPSGELDM